MQLKVYNTLTRKKEIFKPLHGKKVNLFVCGPTVYDFSHLGHAKTYVQFDIIVKYLRFLGYKVFHLQNITDIDDKIIERAKEKKVNPLNLAKDFEKEFIDDMKSLGVDSVNKYAKATSYIKEIENQVERLIKKGFAYKVSDGYYFNLKKFQDYGKLARRTLEQAEDAVSRIDENKEKKNKGDFCLWKFRREGDPYWKSKFGDGRPGWHIEDTAITEKEFGPQYDIHGGAVDLIFPHHEAEIAQMESISGKKPLVKYWLHTAFLNINKEKMAKSSGNFLTIKEVLKKYNGRVIRFFLASNHYRSQINFSYDELEQSKNSLERLNEFFNKLKVSKEKDDISLIEEAEKKFFDAMNDDFDNVKAFVAIFNFVRDVNKKGGGKKSYQLMLKFDKIFNVLESRNVKIPENVKKLAEERYELRKMKEFSKSDELRKRINKLGFDIEDTDSSYVLKKR